MKNKGLSVLLLTLFIFAAPANAQFQRERGTAVFYESGTSVVQVVKTDEVAGSPFYLDEFVSGKVIFDDSSTSETVLMDLDGFTNSIIVKEDLIYKMLTLPNTKGFVFLDKDENVTEFFSTGFENEGLNITPDTFVKVIYNGDVKLIAHFSVIFKPTNFRRVVGTSLSNEYTSDLTYYIINENGDFKKTRLRAKNLINDLGAHKSELKSYVKQSGFKGKTDREAALIMAYYETLNKNS